MKKFSKETQGILDLIKKYKNLRPSHILKILKISEKNLYKHLNILLNAGVVEKSGVTPSVYYRYVDLKESNVNLFDISLEDEGIVNSNYFYLSPSGERVLGMQGFHKWCLLNHQDFKQSVQDYVLCLKAIAKIKKIGLIDATNKILSGQGSKSLDNQYFSDFYTIDRFGKSKLGQLIYLAKSSGEAKIAKEIASVVKPAINNLIKQEKIEFISFIPPTVKRKVQFMSQFESMLNLDVRKFKLTKSVSGVPQKSLRKLDDRLKNASETIYLDPTIKLSGNVLLIDDATGSGATLSETAKKIRALNPDVKKIIGYSVVGSMKGFDVISEV